MVVYTFEIVNNKKIFLLESDIKKFKEFKISKTSTLPFFSFMDPLAGPDELNVTCNISLLNKLLKTDLDELSQQIPCSITKYFNDSDEQIIELTIPIFNLSRHVIEPNDLPDFMLLYELGEL